MTKEQITTVILGATLVVTTLALVATSFRGEEKQAFTLEGVAAIIKATQQEQSNAPSVVNYGDYIIDSVEAKRQGDTKGECCQDVKY